MDEWGQYKIPKDIIERLLTFCSEKGFGERAHVHR
jgi:hypothetical protein